MGANALFESSKVVNNMVSGAGHKKKWKWRKVTEGEGRKNRERDHEQLRGWKNMKTRANASECMEYVRQRLHGGKYKYRN